MDILDEEILNLWKTLNKNETIYIMVGGFATNLHGFARITDDVDLWIKDSLENRKKLRATLKELDIGDLKEIETTQLIPGWTSVTLNSGIELDIMTSLKGLEQIKFDECYSIAPTAIVEGIPVKFLHINQLIEVKTALGRPKDILDVEELEKIRKIKKGGH